MRFGQTAQIMIAVGLISATKETTLEANDQIIQKAILPIALNINNGPENQLNQLLDHVLVDCRNPVDRFVDINQTLSVFNEFERWLNPSDKVPNIPTTIDIGIINRHFYELLDTYCLSKDIVAYNLSNDPIYQNIDSNSKYDLNNGLLTAILMGSVTANTASPNFFASLRDIIIYNFKELGVDCDLILKNIDQIYTSLGFAAESWQKYIGKGNVNAQKNIAFLTQAPETKVENVEGWGSWTKKKLGFGKETPIIATDTTILDGNKVNTLVKDLDESFLNTFVPGIVNLTLSLYIATTLELKKSNGVFSNSLKDRFNKTLSSLLALEKPAPMIYDLFTLVRTRATRVSFHLVFYSFLIIFQNSKHKHLKTIHQSIDELYSKNTNISNGEVCTSVLEKLRKKVFLPNFDAEAELNNGGMFDLFPLISSVQRAMFLSIFKIDEKTDIKNILNIYKDFKQGDNHAYIYGLPHIFNIITKDKSPIQHINIGLKFSSRNIEKVLKKLGELDIPKNNICFYALGSLIFLILLDITLAIYWIVKRSKEISEENE